MLFTQFFLIIIVSCLATMSFSKMTDTDKCRLAQDSLRPVLLDGSLEDKIKGIGKFMKEFKNYPECTRWSGILNFCEDNPELCQKFRDDSPTFNYYMDRYLKNNVPQEETCVKGIVDDYINYIIYNYVISSDINSVSEEIVKATIRRLERKGKMYGKDKDHIEQKIRLEIHNCGFHVDSDGIFRLNSECCFGVKWKN
jgi:hypothetical protein